MIRELSKSSGSEVLIGPGTVLDARDTARRCLDAGAQFRQPWVESSNVELAVEKKRIDHGGCLDPDRGHHGMERWIGFRRRFFPAAKSRGEVHQGSERSATTNSAGCPPAEST